MAATTQLYSFSGDGAYLASSGVDGRLKIFETDTGILKQEYVPSSHLTTGCTSLSWAPHMYDNETPVRKKLKTRNSAIQNHVDKLNLLAMGTATGKILLYSLVKGDLQSEMSGHSKKVNCVSWNLAGNEMFSCCDDGFVVRWNFSKGSQISKWIANKGPVSSVVVLPEGRKLLTSGRSIKFWDIEKKELLKKFNGHASKVFQLKLVNFPNKTSEEGYFISGAAGDRHLSAWHLKNDDKKSVASFSLPDDAVGFDVVGPQLDDNKVILAAISRNGVAHLFEHHLNGKILKPLLAKSTVQISVGDKPAPIVACRMLAGDESNILLAYGSALQMAFEKVPYSSCTRNVSLVRRDPLSDARNERFDASRNASKVATPIVPQNSRVITPNYVVPNSATPGFGAKTKRKLDGCNNVSLLPMEEKLSELKIGPPAAGINQEEFPSSNNLTHLLVQGLHSRDKTILDQVLTTQRTDNIRKSVARLPVEQVAPLIRELCGRIQANQTRTNHRCYLAFLSAVLSSHASFLTTLPKLWSLLGPMQQTFEKRSELLKKMFSLRGKMDFIVTQSSLRQAVHTVRDRPAIATFNDESSDDADSYIDDLLPSHSESEAENWNDFSDDDEVAIEEDDEEEEEEEEEDDGGSTGNNEDAMDMNNVDDSDSD